MRRPGEVLEDLLSLLTLTEYGARARRDGGLERWAIDCARRALSANVEGLRRPLRELEAGLLAARARVAGTLPDEAWADVQRRLAALELARDPDLPVRNASHAALQADRAALTTEAIVAALRCVVTRTGHLEVARVARASFHQPELEAHAQIRRLLLFSRLLPSGADMLVRLDQAEAAGRLPEDPDQLAWIDEQRVLLMSNDERGRMAMLIRHLELLFMVELERLH